MTNQLGPNRIQVCDDGSIIVHAYQYHDEDGYPVPVCCEPYDLIGITLASHLPTTHPVTCPNCLGLPVSDEPTMCKCPACGEYPDYCQGHGPIGDPEGYRICCQHDDGDHTDCVTHCED